MEATRDARPEHLARTGEWFLRSGIQEASGGVARYYRSDLGRNARVSLEITGYAASALLFLHRRTGEAEYLERALSTARFLAARGPLFPFEHPRPGETPCEHAYFFDSGIVLRALLSVWRQTRDRAWLDTAAEAGHTMIGAFISGETLHPIVALDTRRPAPPEPRWAARPGCYQLKAASAWLLLHQETGEAAFLDGWEDALDVCLRSSELFLPGDSEPRRVMDRLHAYCYFLEGLLHAADREPCARAIVEGMARVTHYLRQIEDLFVRSDVYAQLLRLRLWAASLGLMAVPETLASTEAAAAASFQLDADEPPRNGGFCFGLENDAPMPFVNPVSSAFCAQALDLWDHRGLTAGPLDPRDLI